jgi:rhamnosyltransferase
MPTVAAGIVAFNPQQGLTLLVAQLVGRDCPVLVHDNGSTCGLDVLADCEGLGATIVRAGGNSGIAGGLAALLDRATGSYEWLLTFDQDSLIEDGYVDGIMASATLADPKVAIVAPRVVETASGATVQGPAQDGRPREVARVISSGALCRVAALNAIGGFREDLFIDYVDYDLCLRLRAAGWKVVIEPKAVLHHTIGAQTSHRLLGILPVETSNHSADRQYYKYRNYLLLARDRTLLGDPRSAVLDAGALLWGPLKILLFENDRGAKLRAIGHGVADGIARRTGVRPTPDVRD